MISHIHNGIEIDRGERLNIRPTGKCRARPTVDVFTNIRLNEATRRGALNIVRSQACSIANRRGCISDHRMCRFSTSPRNRTTGIGLDPTIDGRRMVRPDIKRTHA